VENTTASDLSGFIASPLQRNHWHSSVRHACMLLTWVATEVDWNWPCGWLGLYASLISFCRRRMFNVYVKFFSSCVHSYFCVENWRQLINIFITALHCVFYLVICHLVWSCHIIRISYWAMVDILEPVTVTTVLNLSSSQFISLLSQHCNAVIVFIAKIVFESVLEMHQ